MKNAYIKFILAAVIFGTNGIIASHIPLSSYEIVLTRTVLGGFFLLILATAAANGAACAARPARPWSGWSCRASSCPGTGSSSTRPTSISASAWQPSCATAGPS